ncbi:MAG TPA: M13 family metallopeptidase [Candidatus Dormibacteraeota bacterium]|nr:M13 family metallopeptidase [Candidatus Dormibacteraeota bacterium]
MAFPAIPGFAQYAATANRNNRVRILIVCVFTLVAGLASVGILRAGQEPAKAKATVDSSHGVDLASLDKTCKACEDFYHYASGLWLKKNPVPAAYPAWNRFGELAERNRAELHQILKNAAANSKAAPGSNELKIGDFYASCMDEKRIDAEGAKPLDPEFARIAAIRNVGEVQAEVARLQGMGVGALFEFGSTQDEKNSTQVIGGADQGGLGLPDRDYYTKTDDKSKQIRQKYQEHIAKMFMLVGDDAATASAEAKTVLELETKLAAASMTRVERRDPDKMYHKMNLAELRTLMPNWSWDNYFQQIGDTHIESVDVSTPKFFQAVNQQLKDTPVKDWKIYLRWHLLKTAAPWLSRPFVNEDFNFRGRTLLGTKKLLPRWKRCVRATDGQLGEALGRIYVQKYFPPQAKARALEMVNQIIAALRDDLQTLPWMGPATRKQALAKLSALTLKIGYPDKWRDYSAYKVDRGPYALNQMRGSQFEFKRDLDKIGKPVDRTEWEMTPPTVNAYYNPVMNEIVFPAGILQPPFFDPHADDASNYGAMGAVIGHEMTHGFDDEGRKFDAQGNLRDWWTPQDAKNFNQRAQCIENQFDGYQVQKGIHENGKLVVGESIADLGGLKIAYRALQKTLQGKKVPLIGGFTPDQRFFLAYAQIWAANDRPEFERLMVNTDPHPLARFRAIAAPSNMPAFAKAFACNAGDAMVRPPAMRCQIW